MRSSMEFLIIFTCSILGMFGVTWIAIPVCSVTLSLFSALAGGWFKRSSSVGLGLEVTVLHFFLSLRDSFLATSGAYFLGWLLGEFWL